MAFYDGMQTQQNSKPAEKRRDKVDLINYVADVARAFKKGHRPGIRRKSTITMFDDGNAIVQCDVEDKLSLQEEFV